jgi:bifunctional DNase/RNase
MVEVKVAHLGVERNSNTPIVVLQEKDGDRLIPIYIGHTEANAIAMELADVKFERPLTHDLLQQVIVGLGAQLSRVLLTRVEKSTYYAELELRRDDHVIQIDARPSDSIAVALRLKSPIFASEELLMAASDEGHPTLDRPGAEPLDSDSLKQYLENLDPEDFGKFTP